MRHAVYHIRNASRLHSPTVFCFDIDDNLSRNLIESLNTFSRFSLQPPIITTI